MLTQGCNTPHSASAALSSRPTVNILACTLMPNQPSPILNIPFLGTGDLVRFTLGTKAEAKTPKLGVGKVVATAAELGVPMSRGNSSAVTVALSGNWANELKTAQLKVPSLKSSFEGEFSGGAGVVGDFILRFTNQNAANSFLEKLTGFLGDWSSWDAVRKKPGQLGSIATDLMNASPQIAVHATGQLGGKAKRSLNESGQKFKAVAGAIEFVPTFRMNQATLWDGETTPLMDQKLLHPGLPSPTRQARGHSRRGIGLSLQYVDWEVYTRIVV